jgi:hypothetical protein
MALRATLLGMNLLKGSGYIKHIKILLYLTGPRNVLFVVPDI